MQALERIRDKVAIVGFAPTWTEAPFHSDDYEIWGLNELYKIIPITDIERYRWFQLHRDWRTARRDENHVDWIKAQQMPIYMWDTEDDVPASVEYPLKELVQYIGYAGDYFTNSISYMIALALRMDFHHIAVYGVDMAHTIEHAQQRPSCEFWLGLQKGKELMARDWAKAGIYNGPQYSLYVPQGADLLKTPFLYGYQSDNAFKVKIKGRLKELTEKLQGAKGQLNETSTAMQRAVGSVQTFQWIARQFPQDQNPVVQIGDKSVPLWQVLAPGMQSEQQKVQQTKAQLQQKQFELHQYMGALGNMEYIERAWTVGLENWDLLHDVDSPEPEEVGVTPSTGRLPKSYELQAGIISESSR